MTAAGHHAPGRVIPVSCSYGTDGRLLYLRAGRQVPPRWALLLPWRPVVVRIHVDWYPDQQAALRAASAIAGRTQPVYQLPPKPAPRTGPDGER